MGTKGLITKGITKGLITKDQITKGITKGLITKDLITKVSIGL